MGPSLPVATTPEFEDDLKDATRHLLAFHGAIGKSESWAKRV